jgi:hypothetical protein
MFEAEKDSFSAPDAFSFEHFLPWIWKIMLAYQDSENNENDEFTPRDSKFSKAYYTKKIN